MNRVSLQFSVVAALFALAGAALAAPRGLPEQVIPQMFGVNIHFAGAKGEEVSQISEAGFKFVRMDFFWSSVEKTKGCYDYSSYDGLMEALDAKGIRPIFIFDYGNPLYDNGVSPNTAEARAAFAAFAGAAAARYKDRGVLWEMWNEPNMGFWRPKPNADDYVALATQAYAAIKAADPNATVLAPAVSASDRNYIEKCFKLGLLHALDAVSVHPYRGGGPETAAGDYGRLRDLIAAYAPKDKAIPIVSSEWGYNTVDQTEERQAQYLVRMFLFNLASDVKLSIWYDWHDDGADPKNREHHFGTVYPDFKPKPSYTAAQVLARELDGYKLARRLGSKADEYVLLFKGPQGYRLAAWTTGDQRDIATPLDAPKVAVVSMDGKRSEVATAAGKLTLTLSGSPVYVEAGPSDRLAMEEAVEFTTSVDTRWRLQDVVTATITNPLSHQLKGAVTLGLPGQKQPLVKRFSAAPGKDCAVRFKPDVTWDGRSSVTADAAVAFDGLNLAVTRQVDLGTSHRTAVRAACPMGRVLEFRISNPSKNPVKGRLKLFDVKGLKPQVTSVPFLAEGETVVAVMLEEPAPKEFSFGCKVVDILGREILHLPVLNYTIVEDFSAVPDREAPADYELVLEGDPNGVAKATADGGRRDSPYTAVPPIPACRIRYEFDAGRRFARLVPKKEMPLPAEPVEVGAWIYGDGSGNTARCRFVDSTGQIFEPSGFSIDWQGWRYGTFWPDGSDSGSWGGTAAGKPRPPLKWDTIFLLDAGGKESRGALYVGPIMVVSEPAEPAKTQ